MASISFEAEGGGLHIKAFVQLPDTTSPADITAITAQISADLARQFSIKWDDEEDDSESWKLN